MSRLWGEEEVLKLLAEWERCVQGASCAQQMLPAAASNATKQRGEGGRVGRVMEGNWDFTLPTCEPAHNRNTGGNYTALLPRRLPLPSYRGPRTPQWKIHVFHFSRHIPAHTHDGAPPDGQHGRLIKLTRTSDYWTLWNYWIKSVMQQSLFLARRRPYLSPAHPGCTHRARQWSDEAHQNRDNKCSMF